MTAFTIAHLSPMLVPAGMCLIIIATPATDAFLCVALHITVAVNFCIAVAEPILQLEGKINKGSYLAGIAILARPCESCMPRVGLARLKMDRSSPQKIFSPVRLGALC